MNETKVNGEELVFGLDIGTRSMVGTVGYRQGERFVVTAQEIRQHQTRAMLDGQIHDINRVAAAIADIRQSLQEKTGIELDEVCIAAAGRVLKTMNVHADMDLDKERNVTKEDMSSLISLGIEQAFEDFQEKNDTNMHFYCVGYSVVRYFLNGMWMGQPEHHKAKTIGADIIATFLPDDVVDGLYSAVELAGLRVANLTLEPIAAIRVAIPEKFRLLNIAMIDVGAGTSDISITDDGSVTAFGMIPCAGDTLTELLAKTCLIDFTTAEMIKTAAATQEEIIYEDIMGAEQMITAKEVIAICQPEIERMSKLAANAVKELNGGKSPSAVFIVGGGGKIKGFDTLVAEELGLDPKRVALRGEEIMRDVDFPDGALKDSTIITPIGICLTYYEQYNNFIYITFNGNRIKLYDNNKLTVTDAAIQADFTRDGLFPRRGEELHYTVNGKNRVTKGEYGESAHVYVNGEEVSLSHNIKANDVIILEESTLGTPAQEKIADLIDYNGKIVVYLKGDEMPLPKPVKVNGTAVTEEYLIQNGDEIVVSTTYTYDEFFEYMGLSPDDMILFINGERANDTMEVCASDQLEFKNRKEYELKEIYKESNIELHSSKRREAKKEEKAKAGEGKETEETAAAEEEKTDTAAADENAQTESESGAEENKSEPESTAEETKSETENDEAVKSEAENDETAKSEEENDEAAETETENDEAVKSEAENKEEAAPGPESEAEVNGQTEPENEIAEPEQPTPQRKTEEVKKEPAKKPEVKAAENKSDRQSRWDSRLKRTHNTARAERTEKREEKKIPETKPKEEPPVDVGKKIIVIVNQKPIVMRGKQSYMFVDIFDYIDFDTRRMQGSGIATLVNGKDAQYTQELYNGDKIEVYWK
ncbi:MAG: cell division protein FtsA [Lachnospiraceae bacterium]|nr:cell division protein FtsA [Lachnospiraceae bacterium]